MDAHTAPVPGKLALEYGLYTVYLVGPDYERAGQKRPKSLPHQTTPWPSTSSQDRMPRCYRFSSTGEAVPWAQSIFRI